MELAQRLVMFTLAGQKLALPVELVERVLRAVEVTPAPETPPTVLGLINMQGRIVPVLDIRPLLGLPSRPPQPSDQFIIARSPTRLVALLAETVADLIEQDEAKTSGAAAIFPHLAHVTGALQHDGEVVLVYSLDRLLAPEAEAALENDRKDDGKGVADAPAC